MIKWGIRSKVSISPRRAGKETKPAFLLGLDPTAAEAESPWAPFLFRECYYTSMAVYSNSSYLNNRLKQPRLLLLGSLLDFCSKETGHETTLARLTPTECLKRSTFEG